MPLHLTAEERQRFASWLEQEAATDEGLAVQMETLGGAAFKALSELRRADAAAARLIAKRLRSIEEASL